MEKNRPPLEKILGAPLPGPQNFYSRKTLETQDLKIWIRGEILETQNPEPQNYNHHHHHLLYIAKATITHYIITTANGQPRSRLTPRPHCSIRGEGHVGGGSWRRGWLPAGEQPQQAPGGRAASVEDQPDAVRQAIRHVVSPHPTRVHCPTTGQLHDRLKVAVAHLVYLQQEGAF